MQDINPVMTRISKTARLKGCSAKCLEWGQLFQSGRIYYYSYALRDVRSKLTHKFTHRKFFKQQRITWRLWPLNLFTYSYREADWSGLTRRFYHMYSKVFASKNLYNLITACHIWKFYDPSMWISECCVQNLRDLQVRKFFGFYKLISFATLALWFAWGHWTFSQTGSFYFLDLLKFISYTSVENTVPEWYHQSINIVSAMIHAHKWLLNVEK